MELMTTTTTLFVQGSAFAMIIDQDIYETQCILDDHSVALALIFCAVIVANMVQSLCILMRNFVEESKRGARPSGWDGRIRWTPPSAAAFATSSIATLPPPVPSPLVWRWDVGYGADIAVFVVGDLVICCQVDLGLAIGIHN
jgi:hypothetical protein